MADPKRFDLERVDHGAGSLAARDHETPRALGRQSLGDPRERRFDQLSRLFPADLALRGAHLLRFRGGVDQERLPAEMRLGPGEGLCGLIFAGGQFQGIELEAGTLCQEALNLAARRR